MELRHLKYFVAVAEERSITRAAERLWIAQPGLSTQMRRLEAELGVQLLDRHIRGVDLTDAGRLFLERARAALAAAEHARATGRKLEAGLLGTIRLGLASEMPAHLAPSLLAAFAREHPEIELGVLSAYAGALLRDLRDGRLDAVLAPAGLGSGELPSARLGSEPWVVLTGAGHRLAGHGPVAASRLHGESVVVTGHRDGAAHDRAVSELLMDLGVPHALRRGGPGPALYADVEAGEAVALTTASAAHGRELLARPLDPVRRVRFALLWNEETPALGRLIRFAEDRPVTRPALASVA